MCPHKFLGLYTLFMKCRTEYNAYSIQLVVINVWPVKPFETVLVIKGYSNKIGKDFALFHIYISWGLHIWAL